MQTLPHVAQDKNGVWNQFGGRLAWDATAIVSDDAHFRGKGNRSTGDSFGAAPNIDHSQEFVRRDLAEWLQWLRAHAGYDGWRCVARGVPCVNACPVDLAVGLHVCCCGHPSNTVRR